MSYKVVSIFCGCGGLDQGFRHDLFDIALAIDNDPVAVETYNLNLSPVAISLDVTSGQFHALLTKLGGADVVVGGFPCQGFSKAGPKAKHDPRNKLYGAMVDAVRMLKPKIFVAENVDGLEQNFRGEYLNAIKRDFSELGYSVENRILNFLGFGVPQHRRRIFFVGAADGYVWTWPEYSHEFETRNGERKIEAPLFDSAFAMRLPALTISDAIGDLRSLDSDVPDHEVRQWKAEDNLIIRRIGEGQKLCNVRFSDTSVYTWEIPEVFGETTDLEKAVLETIAKNRRRKRYGSIPNGNPLPTSEVCRLLGEEVGEDVFESLVNRGFLKKIDVRYDLKGAMFCSGTYKRPRWDEPSPTILTNFFSPRYFLHPKENRPFSVRECARLQSFDDGFRFCGDLVDKYRLIGNAVPPLASQRIADAVHKTLESGE